MQSATLTQPRPSTWARWAAVQQRTVLFVLTIIATLTRTGAYWDVQWHAVVGRDSFWIPPHDLIYGGVALSGLLSLFVVARDRYALRWARPIPWPWLAMMAGAGLLVSAAPFDDLWHRRFGIDVTIWSPPHMVGVIGSWLIKGGIVAGWAQEYLREREGGVSRNTWIGLVWAAALLVSMLNFALVPAVRWSVTQPVTATLYALLGGLLIPLTFVLVAKITGRWWLPLALLGGLAVLRLLDLVVHSFSVAVVVPLYTSVFRGSPESISRHFTTHLLLNIAPALAVAVVTLLMRGRFGWRWAISAGLASSVLLMLDILVLRTGLILPVFPANAGRDYRGEVIPFINIFGRSELQAWMYVLIAGVISALIGWSIAQLLTPRPRSVAEQRVVA